MRNDIKTKVKNNIIKEKQNKKYLSNYIKERVVLHEKEEPNNDTSTTSTNAQKDAVHNVEQSAKVTIFKSHQKSKRIIDNYASRSSKIDSDTVKNININKYSYSIKSTPIKQNDAQMKSLFTYKSKLKSKEQTIASNTSKKVIDNISTLIKSTMTFVKNTISSISTLIGLGIGALLLVVVSLFIGIFASFTDNSVYGASLSPLSEEVIAYTDTITEYAEKYGVEEYIALIQAIMMVESKGLGNDPMDAGIYINQVIYNPEYSIEIGVKYLANCLNKANVTSPADTEKIYLSIQGYDFKDDYIIWALNNFNGYSKSNAQVYHDQFLSDGDINYVNHVMQYIGFSFGTFRLEPNFDNNMAWGYNNPYSRVKLYGQCTWFAWGRFYEIYGYSPGFTGDGWKCAQQLVNAHPDKFELSSSPQVGAIFSCIGRNHTGIVVGWDGVNITIQEGNLDGKTNSFAYAKGDWRTVTYNIDTFRNVCDGVVFAIPSQTLSDY